METHDAIVIGGGPAGSASALALARLGWRTLLLERGAWGRAKACGQCLSARGRAALGALGVADDTRCAERGPARSLRVHARGGARFATALMGADGRSGVVVERSALDDALGRAAERAGARVERGASARVIGRASGGFEVEMRGSRGARRARAELVVGADGLGSGVARATGLFGRGRAGRKFGFALDFAPTTQRGPERGVVEMFLAPDGGYLGVVARSDGLAHAAGLVGAGGASREPAAFVERCADAHPALRALVGARLSITGGVEACGPMAWRPERVACAGVALVGDAAGYPEPFTGEGMSWALESALALGEAAAGARPGAWGEGEAERYAALWRGRVGRRGVVCRALGAALERPGAARLATLAARAGPGIAGALARRVVSA